MSFRISVSLKRKGKKIDDYQLLGNNENYLPLEAEFKRQGVNTDKPDCYDGQLFEVQPIIEKLEDYIWEKEKYINGFINEDGTPKSIFNLYPSESQKRDLTAHLMELHDWAYMFVSVNFVKFLERNKAVDMSYDVEKRKIIYFLKDDYELFVDAG